MPVRPALTRHRSSRHSSPQQDAVLDAPFVQKLHQNGLAAYVPLFEAHNLSEHVLQSLSNAELRDEVRMNVLAHRRKMLSLTQPARSCGVPVFGAILVHLSNVRTCHSWIRTTFQAVILSLAVSRLGALRDERIALGVAIGICCMGAVHSVYGGWRYLAVMKRVENGMRFSADTVGAVLALCVSLCVAALVLLVLLEEGFAPRFR